MARPRAFEIEVVLSQSRELFAARGYNGTSIDDLVKATGLLRGSIYKAFGSKRNLFVAVLKATFQDFEASAQNLDLLTVALKDLASSDMEIQRLCRKATGNHERDIASMLGKNLLSKIREK